jgi:hypothetical protein
VLFSPILVIAALLVWIFHGWLILFKQIHSS